MSINLAPGTLLGRYKIVAPLDAGAMGAVYRAADTFINREVALKILKPELASDSERLHRFEQEVQAAGALKHPNIMVVYDVGVHEGLPYVVSELLEGETLRKRIDGTPLPARKAVLYALQLARGLASAHEKGIVHRDLKPENIFVTKDGQIKILDFGLAKLRPPNVAVGEADTNVSTVPPETKAGTLMGTVGYMSPEQVRGHNDQVDHRSDIFAFGAVFYEMLTGRRAFRRDTPVETMNSILNEDPPAMSGLNPGLDPMTRGVAQHCLEKNAEQRYQSMRDVAFDMELLLGAENSGSNSRALISKGPRRRWWPAAALAALFALGVGGAFVAGKRARGRETPPSYSQLTFRRGTVWSARFAPDGQTVVYSATWDGNRLDVFTTHPGTPEARPLNLTGANILSISSASEMAVLLNPQHLGHFASKGVLARMSMYGTVPRPVLADVQDADWSPDGSNLAVVINDGSRNRIEYPVGTVLFSKEGWISNPRVSPDGERVAFFEHPVQWDDRGWVTVADRAGNAVRLSGEWSSAEGLAWSPSGDGIWYTAKKSGEAAALYSSTLGGDTRVLVRAPINLILHDVSRGGRVLLSRGYDTTDFLALFPGESKERNLSWLDRGAVRDVSPDGRTLIFTQWGAGSGTNYSVYLRRTDGSPAVRLGDGSAWSLSPDGGTVLATLFTPPQLVLLPTGAGGTRVLDTGGIEQYGLGASWLPDGKRVLFIGRETGKMMRCFVRSIDGGGAHPVTPEGVTGTLVSPNGKWVIGQDAQQRSFLYPLEGGEAQPVNGLGPQDRIINWGTDDRTLYVRQFGDQPVKIYRLDPWGGSKEKLKEIMPSDSTGILDPIHIILTPDGRHYFYNVRRYLSTLYLVDGISGV
jgi:serine/threonine protein kinase